MRARAALAVALAGVLLAAGAQAGTVTLAVNSGSIGSVEEAAVATEPADRLTPPGPTLGGCPVYPTDNAWNTRIRDAPLLANSTQMIAYIQNHGSDNLHPDFGTNGAGDVAHELGRVGDSLQPPAAPGST